MYGKKVGYSAKTMKHRQSCSTRYRTKGKPSSLQSRFGSQWFLFVFVSEDISWQPKVSKWWWDKGKYGLSFSGSSLK